MAYAAEIMEQFIINGKKAKNDQMRNSRNDSWPNVNDVYLDNIIMYDCTANVTPRDAEEEKRTWMAKDVPVLLLWELYTWTFSGI